MAGLSVRATQPSVSGDLLRAGRRNHRVRAGGDREQASLLGARTMAVRKTKVSKAEKLNAATNAFLQELNGGPLSFGQMLTALRESEEQTLNQFATRLGVSRQHLHQLEAGQKR